MVAIAAAVPVSAVVATAVVAAAMAAVAVAAGQQLSILCLLWLGLHHSICSQFRSPHLKLQVLGRGPTTHTVRLQFGMATFQQCENLHSLLRNPKAGSILRDHIFAVGSHIQTQSNSILHLLPPRIALPLCLYFVYSFYLSSSFLTMP